MTKIIWLSLSYLSLVLALLLMGCEEKSLVELTSSDHKNDKKKLQLKAKSQRSLFMLEAHLDQVNGPDEPFVGGFHRWIITLRDINGDVLYPANILVSGGMPAHGHGLPSQPRVTKYLGEGRYLIEGIKFNMSGRWVLYFNISTSDMHDVIELKFEVNH